MEVKALSLKGLLLFTPRTHADERGRFRETWSHAQFQSAVGERIDFVQDNESLSHRGVIRGLHFQVPPHAQGKLVRCAAGRVLDVVVDIRRESPTYGRHERVELSASNGHQLWVPPGFAHGFACLDDGSILQYKCTEYYAPRHEGSLLWNDPELRIDWGVDAPKLSPKDAGAPTWRSFDSPF